MELQNPFVGRTLPDIKHVFSLDDFFENIKEAALCAARLNISKSIEVLQFIKHKISVLYQA